MGKPIDIFKSQAQLDECLAWWQEKLFLQDWIIKARLCAADEFETQEEGQTGENSFVFKCKESQISILSHKYRQFTPFAHWCEERTLVHELLHLIYDTMECTGSYEGVYLEAMEHQKLDAMAKSLIMVKYNIGLDYFKEV